MKLQGLVARFLCKAFLLDRKQESVSGYLGVSTTSGARQRTFQVNHAWTNCERNTGLAV